jgi:hypothetical protein
LKKHHYNAASIITAAHGTCQLPVLGTVLWIGGITGNALRLFVFLAKKTNSYNDLGHAFIDANIDSTHSTFTH